MLVSDAGQRTNVGRDPVVDSCAPTARDVDWQVMAELSRLLAVHSVLDCSNRVVDDGSPSISGRALQIDWVPETSDRVSTQLLGGFTECRMVEARFHAGSILDRVRRHDANAPGSGYVPVDRDMTVTMAASHLRCAGRDEVAEQLSDVYGEAKADGGDLWFDRTAAVNAVAVICDGVLTERFPSVVIGPGVDGAAHVRYDDDSSGEMLNLVFERSGRVRLYVVRDGSLLREAMSYEQCEARLREIAQSA